ncbi:bifunctional 23S rRNA (guanine(2069)-N(7))-methyltransferase RlmK/23S rRNA (guanine(2445)-N(2))-methyltransferase RlmL [Oceaniserpentilla sp. 4NH20-0058]|uniref:bifunctional 23S rRNA (guanine(2069)-N(7))-methyltransferase RlmK/23S rRNA (guanine(2445)-N(2))-methyltransferase RlmL n=1 Tax=Oceaniserpentilla sp. 4NH20-0058 TaxID=3127660 RepID=UPI003341E208
MQEPQEQPMVITCPKGLESLLAQELTDLGAQGVKLGVAFVSCQADQVMGYKVCLWSRLASRVLYPLAHFPVENADDMYQQLLQINWLEHLSDRQTFRVYFSGTNDDIRNTHFGALKVKDAVCDYFRDKTGTRPDISDQPDISIHVRLSRDAISVSLDMAGEPLHKRGYRQSQGLAPLKENLAAALLTRAGWPKLMKQEDGALLDPMCGSGTLLIEAALMAADIAPGLLRNQFAFEKWKTFQSPEWREIKQDAENRKQAAQESEVELTLIGYDMDEKVLNKAKDNARRAGVMHFIHFKNQTLNELTKEKGLPESGLILSNPPYGERLSDEVAIGSLYAAFGRLVKQNFANWTLGVFTGNPGQAYQFKMRAHKQYQFYNGAIASKLFLYTISEGSSEKAQAQAQVQLETGKTNEPVVLGEGAQMVCNRLKKNLKKIRSWVKKQNTNCYRLYDADMPEYSVAIDVYDKWVHIQEYAPPKSVDPEKAENRLRDILDAVPVALNIDREQVVLKQRKVQKGKRQYEKQDKQEQFFEVQEGNCRFYVNLTDYLDSGLFLDHRPIRMDIAQWAKNKDFLNLFSYTCTASVHAAVGGARSTTSVDMSQTYLNWGRKNLALNGLADTDHQFIQADCTKWLEQAQHEKDRYDLIFMDPPSFSNSKRMMDIFDVQRDHVSLIEHAMGLLRPGGTLVFSNNLRRFKMEHDALEEFKISDVSEGSIPQDFARNQKIHQCFLIENKS